MSQMSAGSRTDVGAYHRDDNEATEKHLGDLSGQFSLMDHRTASEVSHAMVVIRSHSRSCCVTCQHDCCVLACVYKS
jgi:hypothetical protein